MFRNIILAIVAITLTVQCLERFADNSNVSILLKPSLTQHREPPAHRSAGKSFLVRQQLV